MENDKLTQLWAEVYRLHAPEEIHELGSRDPVARFCSECHRTYPCPTVQLLEAL